MEGEGQARLAGWGGGGRGNSSYPCVVSRLQMRVKEGRRGEGEGNLRIPAGEGGERELRGTGGDAGAVLPRPHAHEIRADGKGSCFWCERLQLKGKAGYVIRAQQGTELETGDLGDPRATRVTTQHAS